VPSIICAITLPHSAHLFTAAPKRLVLVCIYPLQCQPHDVTMVYVQKLNLFPRNLLPVPEEILRALLLESYIYSGIRNNVEWQFPESRWSYISLDYPDDGVIKS